MIYLKKNASKKEQKDWKKNWGPQTFNSKFKKGGKQYGWVSH